MLPSSRQWPLVRGKRHDEIVQLHKKEASHEALPPLKLRLIPFILNRYSDIRAIVADSPYASLEGVIARQFFFLPGPTKWPLVAVTKFYARLFLGLTLPQTKPCGNSQALC